MYYLREHLRIGSTTNRFGEKVYFAEIEIYTEEVIDGITRQMLHIERLSTQVDERTLRKQAIVRYRQFYPHKKTGRVAKRCNSTYKGRQVIIPVAAK